MKKKICFYGNLYSAFMGRTSGGGELQISYLAKGSVINGLDVYIIDITESKPDQKIEGVNFIFTKNGISIAKILISIRPDFVYGRIRGINHFIPCLVSKFINAKYILGLAHDLDVSDFNQRLHDYYQDKSLWYFLKKGILTEILYFYVLRNADLVIAQHINQLKKLTERNIKTTITLPNIFVSNKKISNTSFEINYDFVYVGSLDKRKGLSELLQIINHLNEKKILVIGRFRGKDIEKNKKELIKHSHITYIEKINHNEVFDYIHRSSALISSSISEGFPNVFLEAWSLNKPVFSLWVDPGGVISSNNLGVCYQGNIKKMISDLLSFKKQEVGMNFENYLIKNHSFDDNSKRFVEKIKSL